MAKTTSVADYQVLFAGQKILNANIGTEKEITFNFTVPSDLIHTGVSRQPIFAFKARPFEDSKIEIILNGTPVVPSVSLDKSLTRIFWEVISFDPALSGSHGTTVDFRFLLLEGKLRVSDVVLWYQVNKPWD